MISKVDEHSSPTRHSSVVYAAVVGVAVLIIATLAAVLFFGSPFGQLRDRPVAKTIRTTEPDEATIAALIVLDSATRVSRYSGVNQSFGVAYAINVQQPASDVIQQISSRLETLGYRPLENDWLNPGLPSSHICGWTQFLDGTRTPMHQIHRWGAQWQDNPGNIVDYTLDYSYPESGTKDLQSLWIDAAWYSAAGAETMQDAAKQLNAK